MSNEKTYFANLKDTELVTELFRKVTEYYEEIERIGRLGLWRKIHRHYFSLDKQGYHEASEIQRGGEQGELSMLKASHYRNLLQHLHVLVTQQKPSFECRAINTDFKSQVQTILGRNILEYYLRECRLNVQFRYAAEVAIAYGEAYVEIGWDPNKGDPVAADIDEETGEPTGAQLNIGDIYTRVYEPRNVIRPCRVDADEGINWYILKRHESRHDLAAAYPDQADAILGFSADDNSTQEYLYTFEALSSQHDDDRIPTYTFYHERTPACPNGRQVKFLGADIALEQGDLKYTDLPVYPMMPSKQHGTSFGYSVSFDLLCVQDAIDLLYSTILSNQASFGVQNVWMKPGTALEASQLAGGLNVLQSEDKPEPINLTHTPPEIFKFLQGVETLGEVLSGVNSVARGQPEANLKSGAALALVASQAVQFSNGLQAAYAQLLEDTGTAILRTLQTRATLPRAAVIAGKDNKSYVKDFTGQDLSSLSRVIVDIGNPVSRTIAGRLQMAQDMMQAQVIKRPEQYISVIETGTLEPIIEDERSEQLLINAENEALRDGKPVVVTAIDQHIQHVKGHRQVLADPDARQDQNLVSATLEHINEHLNALRTVDPALLNALGQAPIATQPNGAPTPPQGANAPQPAAAPAPGPGDQGPPGDQPPGQQVEAPPGSPPGLQQAMPKMPAPPPTK